MILPGFCLEGITENKKLKLEHKLLAFQKHFQSCPWNQNFNFWETVRNYSSLLRMREGLFYQRLIEKTLHLRNQLMLWEGDEDVQQKVGDVAITRRELENAEKMYLISRWRCMESKSSTDVDHKSSICPNDLLQMLLSQKRELMKLEGEYVGSMRVGGKFFFEERHEYSEEELRRTERSKGELLVLEEYITLVEKPSCLQKVVDVMLSTRIHWPMVKSVVHDFKINNKIHLLRKMVHSREKFLEMEREYLSLLQERYTMNYYDNTSFDIHVIHSEYVWEYALETILRWRDDLRLPKDTIVREGQRRIEKFGNSSSVTKDKLKNIVRLNEELKKVEEKYCKVVRQRYLAIHNNNSSNDVARGVDQRALLKDDMLSLRGRMDKLENDFNGMIGGEVERYHSLKELCRSHMEQIEDRYFDQLGLEHSNKRGASNEEGGSSDSVPITIPAYEKVPSFQPNNNVRKWKIQRSIVLGGLIESITSLVMVTSAASIDISNENIVTLTMTNLITGLFIVRHNLSGLKKNRLEKEYNGAEVEGRHHYREEVIDTMHYLLHFIIAFLSFLFCGLVPPLVYAFSFPKSGNKNFKIIATMGASLLCTTMLAILKVHIQKPKEWGIYVKTAATYISIGAVAFSLSYLAGNMIVKLTEKFPWEF